MRETDYQIPPKEGFILTHFLTVADVKRSAEFYLRILGGDIVLEGEPTDDKPTVTLRTPRNMKEVSNFMNIRVADIWSCYEEWRSKGAEFLTEPKDHRFEIRCYMRDPDGYIIEVGQSKSGSIK